MINQIGKLISGTEWNPNSIVGAVAYFVVFMLIALIVARTLRAAFTAALKRDTHGLIDRTTTLFLAQVTQIVVYIIAFTLYAHVVPVLNSLGTALLTGVSVSAVVIGLAAQSTLANFISGISLLLYRPFSLGDSVQINAPSGLETGVVNSLTLGYTVLETFDNRHIVVPNSVMATQITVNLTRVDPRAMAIVPINISYASDVEKARQILVNLAEAHPLVKEVVNCPLIALGDSAVTLSLRAWCANAGDASQVEFALYEQIIDRYGQAGIELPYPYSNVILHHAAALQAAPATGA
ncbi:MAG: mechanosensitive ion channel family protein [Caldilineaceae bacterium]|nr:mechanosensitive ion channel family protein [Caldilineaceae bacterium]